MSRRYAGSSIAIATPTVLLAALLTTPVAANDTLLRKKSTIQSAQFLTHWLISLAASLFLTIALASGVVFGGTIGTRVGKYLPSDLMESALGVVFGIVGLVVLVTEVMV